VTSDPTISRRALLRAMVAGSVAAGLAACGVQVTPAPGSPTAPPTSNSTSSSTASAAPTATATPSPPPTPSPSTDPAALRAKIARLLLVGFRGLEIGPDDPITKALAAGLGGVILFDRDQTTGGQRNISSPKQLAKLTAALRAAAPGPILIAIDQEGGTVSRLNPAKGFPATRTQAAIGATGDPAVALAAGKAMGTTMHSAGIDLDLAPVVDVNVNPKNPAIGALGRSFSAHPAVVAAMAEAEIRGLHAAGVRSTVKHFPGLGSAAANTDFAVVDVTKTWTAAELEPYRSLIASGVLDAVMSGNIVNRTLDPDGVPASLSAPIIEGSLRRQLGWTGPVVTDDLGAVAITSRYKQADAVARALGAGNDLLVFANQASYVPDLAARLVGTIEALVAAGHVTEARIDASIARLDVLASPPTA
jgi:beta-N-acetylhexosaminidase